MVFSDRRPLFDVRPDRPPSSTLLCGFSAYGLAGLTAVDYLVDHLSLEPTGHVTTEELPAITPFADGVPRHHTRFYSRPDLDVSVLVGELFVPRPAARGFADAIVDWADDAPVDELCVLSGVPVSNAPDEDRTFYVATEDFVDHRLDDHDVTPMTGGYLDGVNAALVERGLDGPHRVGVLSTPVHARAPDVDAALRLVETVQTLYDLDVDLAPLRTFAEEVRRHYEELAQRIEEAEEEPQRRHEDRMYM